jgi:hypothetical protein
MRTIIVVAAMLSIALVVAGACQKDEKTPAANAASPSAKAGTSVEQGARPLVTFVELGSVTCIPCRKMQPIRSMPGR